jgi:hypothetical protein
MPPVLRLYLKAAPTANGFFSGMNGFEKSSRGFMLRNSYISAIL